MTIRLALDAIRKQLLGAKLSNEDCNLLITHFSSALLPGWFINMLSDYPLIGVNLTLSEALDESSFGVDMVWLSPKQMVEEALETYPGIIAIQLGYLPIGSCLFGSGDPYFLKMTVDNDNPPFVRIPHDILDENDKIDDSKIEPVCFSLSSFFELSQVIPNRIGQTTRSDSSSR
ncbi:MAG: hypothetical protein DRR19_29840 [Candidatus Parabeggiatoa sp. nov. 1]|nr:MAG: hypothetical protein DRR19_29840 [Gammaproteobacteria bacterium]